MIKKRNNVLIFILLTFFLKLGIAAYFSELSICQNPDHSIGSISLSSGDTFSYIGSIENLLEKGVYYFEHKGKISFAGRMPYYGVIYYLLRQVTDKNSAADIYIILQIFIDAVANFFLALLVFDILNRKWLSYLAYLLYFCSFNLFGTSLILAPESLSLSIFIIFLYSVHKYWKERSQKLLLLSSILLALVTVLKPYLIIFYPVLLATILFKDSKHQLNKKVFFQTILVLTLPLLILLLPWITRNALLLGRFIPAQENTTAGYNYTEGDFAFRRFVRAWGGDVSYWDPKAAGCYFHPNLPFPCTFQIPNYALTDKYGVEKIEDVRQDYLELQRNYSPDLEKKVIEKFDNLTNIYKSEKPFMYHFFSRVLSLKGMFWNTNNANLPIYPSFRCYRSYQLLFKVVQFIIYACSITIGVFGLIYLLYKKKLPLFFILVPILLVTFFAFIRAVEPRYFNHAYPIMLIGLIGFINLIMERVLNMFSYDKNPI
jgi:hypothetical protein